MNSEYVRTIIALALAEDKAFGDITTNSLVPKSSLSAARLVVKSDGVVCGLEFAKEAFRQLDPKISFKSSIRDGQKVKAGTVLAIVRGSSRALLSGERTALNFLSYLSAIATKTRSFVDAVKPYRTDILDTRKTTPLLRGAERYAVRIGGGVNHRFDLGAMAMIKDNHRVFAAGKFTLAGAVDEIRRKHKKAVELEVDTFEEFAQALDSRADVILLDNMTPAQVRRAVALRKKVGSKVLLEASGGIGLKNVRQYAAAGVERISIGGLTHSRQALDISLELDQ